MSEEDKIRNERLNIKDYVNILQQKNKELENINDKLSSALNSAEQRIDKAIELINNIYFGNFFSDLKPIKLADSKEVKEIISILKGEYK